jgi:hypothetical protein
MKGSGNFEQLQTKATVATPDNNESYIYGRRIDHIEKKHWDIMNFKAQWTNTNEKGKAHGERRTQTTVMPTNKTIEAQPTTTTTTITLFMAF